mmetsp:Transcript_16024/g.22371  ORF Transcript_16024/g.22371 Transcript_16024/m.22371 type:complete len:333 (-) Transcript_16024:63-1061(-)
MEEGAAVGWYTHVKGDIETPLTIEKETVVLGDKRLRRRTEALKQIEKQKSARAGCNMGSKIADLFASLIQHCVRYVGIWAVYEVSYEIDSYIKDDNIRVMAFALYSLLWVWTIVLHSILINAILVGACPQQSTKELSITENTSFLLRWSQASGYTSSTAQFFLIPMAGTVFVNIFSLMMGAKVSLSALLLSIPKYDYRYLRIGRRVIVDEGSVISGHFADGVTITFGPLRLESNSVLGAQAYAHCGDHIEKSGILSPLSKMLSGSIKRDEIWNGIPAWKTRTAWAHNHQECEDSTPKMQIISKQSRKKSRPSSPWGRGGSCFQQPGSVSATS